MEMEMEMEMESVAATRRGMSCILALVRVESGDPFNDFPTVTSTAANNRGHRPVRHSSHPPRQFIHPICFIP
jgi:hypothetical protein